MKLRIEWGRPIRLRDAATKSYMIYDLDHLDLSKITADAGVYIFGRVFGSHFFEALYVGKSRNVRKRIKNHLQFDLQLILRLRDKPKAGRRVVLAGKLITGKGPKSSKCLALSERALIRHFVSEGHDLLNRQGIRRPRHELKSSGNYPKRFFPKTIYDERAKGE